MSSRIDEDGTVTITAPVYATMPVGYRLRVENIGLVPDPFVREFADFRARLALSQSGRAHYEAVRVTAPEGALAEALQNGSLHASLEVAPGLRG